MHFQKGQIWSLDVVLAAVLFTLAIGLIVGQTELNVFASQQDRNMRELQSMALLASYSLVSSPEVPITTPSPSSVRENIRCGAGPNGWSFDYDLSWIQNCILNRPGSLSPDSLGLPSGFDVRVEVDGGLFPWFVTTSSLPLDVPFFSVSRRMLILPDVAGPSEFRSCLDGGCASELHDVTITVWRS